MKPRPMYWLLLAGALVGVCSPAAAASQNLGLIPPQGEAASAPGPGRLFTLQDLSGAQHLSLSLPVVPASPRVVGVTLAPLLSGQLDLDPFSLGLALPLALTFHQDADDTVVLGNPALEARFKFCSRGGWRVCGGAALGLSAGLIEQEEDSGDWIAQTAGFFAHQDLLYHSPHDAVLRPLALLTAAYGGLWLQLELGSAVRIPVRRTGERDVRGDMLLNFGAGYRLEGLGRIGLEFRGLFPVRQKAAHHLAWLNLGAWLDFGAVEPLLRIAVPLREEAEFGAPLHFAIGLAYGF